MFDLLIKNISIVKNNEVFIGDVGVNNEKISAIINTEADSQLDILASKSVIDGTGQFLFPGVVDSHVHLNDPGFTWREDFLHGTESAAIGGVTTIVDMPLQNEPALTNKDIFLSKKEHLFNKSYIDYGFWGGLVSYNLNNLEELNNCGVLAFKCFFAPVSADYTSLDTGKIREAMKIIKSFNGLAAFHCEDYSIIKYEEEKAISKNRVSAKDFLNTRPVIAELLAVRAIISLAEEIGTKVHICHVSHPLVAEEIKLAKKAGVKITAETCPHYLAFNEDDLINKGTILKCAPPLRSKEDSNRLWDYVIDGTIDIISSDHSPCTIEEKQSNGNDFLKAWGGISGIQTAMQVLFSEAIVKRNLSPSLLAKVLSSNAADIFSLTAKGSIEIGKDADFVIVNPEKQWSITSESLHYLNKISGFVGLKGIGCPVTTILRGNIICNNGTVLCSPNFGKILSLYM